MTRLRKMVKKAVKEKLTAEQLARLAGISVPFADRLIKEETKEKK